MKIVWNDKTQYQRCYEFLFDELKRCYLVHMFPSAFQVPQYGSNPSGDSASSSRSSSTNSLNYLMLGGTANTPMMPEYPIFDKLNDERKLIQIHCKEEIIKWIINILMVENDYQSFLSNDTETL